MKTFVAHAPYPLHANTVAAAQVLNPASNCRSVSQQPIFTAPVLGTFNNAAHSLVPKYATVIQAKPHVIPLSLSESYICMARRC